MKVPTPPRYTQVPNSVIDNIAELSGAEVKLYLVILRDAAAGRCHPKRTMLYLQQQTGLYDYAIMVALERLLEYGLIRKAGAYYEPAFAGDSDNE